MDKFYRFLEDRFRGTQESVRKRLEFYEPFIAAIAQNKSADTIKAFDIGCGRGEFISYLNELGIQACGCDSDNGMLEAAKQKGLNVVFGDAISAISELEDESMDIISSFHVVEHLPFDALLELFKQSYRVLKPNGIIIFETPNCENIAVATHYFWLDYTHNEPLPSELLEVIAEFIGFEKRRIMFLESWGKVDNPFLYPIYGASADYTLLAQKKDNGILNELFSKQYGITLQEASEKTWLYYKNLQLQLEENKKEIEHLKHELSELNQNFYTLKDRLSVADKTSVLIKNIKRFFINKPAQK